MDYSTLNKEQLRAVQSDSDRILCLAGAGTGKTHTLVSRMVRLYEDGVLPKQMLAITFTRAAGNEMKKRAIEAIGPQAEDLFCNTFHSFAAKILRKYAHKIGYTPFFTIYDEEDRLSIIQSIIRDYNYNCKDKDVLKALDKSYKYNVPPEGDVRRAIDEYKYVMMRNNAFDFDMLIHEFFRLLIAHDDVREYVHNTYTHIFVDEFQDSDNRQMGILDTINPQNLFLVGDDFQSIYGFAGADVSLIMFIACSYRYEVIKLEQNYRSTKPIVTAANNLIRHNKQTEKVLKTEKDGEDISRCLYDTIDEEARGIAMDIALNRIKSGSSYSDHAVLCRTNKQAACMAEKIEEYGVPTELKGKTIDIMFSRDAKGIFAWMATILNSMDDQNLLTALSYSNIILTRKDRLKAESYQLENNISLMSALRDNNMVPEFFRIHDKILTEKNEEWNVNDMLNSIIIRIGIVPKYAEVGLQNRIDDIMRIQAAVDEWVKEPNGEDQSPEAWMEYYKLLRLNGTLKESEKEDAVQVMTAHKSKGLEWPCVFISGCYDKSFPLGRGDLEEERRLFYVAITRAKEKLMLTTPEWKENWAGRLEPTKESIFMDEI